MSSSEAILERIREAVIVLGPDKRVVEWRGAARRLFGWSREEIVGEGIEERLRPTDANGNPACIGPCGPRALLRIARGTPEHEMLATTKDGGTIWIGVTCSFDRGGDGRVVRTVAVARDISRRKSVDLAKSEVISAVSHELRSPLTSVKGFTSTLLNKWDRFDDETKKQLLFTINTDADRVTRLIGELLDVSRLEAGRLQLRRQMVQIATIAGRVVERIQPRADKHILRTQFANGFPEVFADADKVEQVLTNLVENAVKYTEEGEVTVSGTVEDAYVRISVADQGEGIPADQRMQVFGKFFRRGARTDSPTGTGLGLYISKGLIEAHGGRIWVDEGQDGGAVFSFTLPAS